MSATGRDKFLLDELFSMTLAATVQRSTTYQKDVTEEKKNIFRRDLQRSLVSLSEQYRTQVSEPTHCKNIQALAKELSIKHGKILDDGHLRIGSAQKALNLYLKYLWCLGRIEMPPHCPIDRAILDEIQKKTGYKSVGWTRLDSITLYEEIIHKAKTVAGKLALSEWELQFYNAD